MSDASVRHAAVRALGRRGLVLTATELDPAAAADTAVGIERAAPRELRVTTVERCGEPVIGHARGAPVGIPEHEPVY